MRARRAQTFVYLFCFSFFVVVELAHITDTNNDTADANTRAFTHCHFGWRKMLETMIQMGKLNCNLNVIISSSCKFPHADVEHVDDDV